MRPDDILKEVLSDPELIRTLKIDTEHIVSASMNTKSPCETIEIIKTVIRGGYNGLSPQQMFNEIKQIKGV